MRRLKRLQLLLLALFPLTFQGSVCASEDLVSGRWRCVGKGFSNEDIHFTLNLRQAGEAVTGTVTVGEDVVDISEGSIRDDRMELITSTDDNRYVSSVSVTPGKLKATWKDANGNSGTWEGEKLAEDAK
jgi:hypothetical protein